MTYAIIGSGNIGSAVAGHFARIGLDVAVAASRGPAGVAPLAERLGSHIVPTDVSDALLADVVVLAVPFDAVEGLVGQVTDWNGRIIVDATNAIDYSTFSPADLGGRASSDLVEQWSANARVVKAFGHTWAKVLAHDPGDGHGGRRVLFVSGNDAAANADVAALIEQFGFEAIDLGRNDQGGLLQQFGGPLTTRSFISQAIGGASPAEMDLIDA
ncbi:NADPH-dependent F420 reductase [Mycolicibacterium aichiense]|uniref:NADP oxidoreductase n=1 Tax=Mycolicibacterium aichiense TaxID=1799 RepID=A0AAD1HUJ9_9MYCO|nr:NAD(P)-binding domain-containing protein [Mycolicibacterium aichiense]MCV7017536.1 NAD(P)-binding domain-containing protein [Mycolicibacterium aichiense]BBX09366.1 NADP oxidoreductase [Mycolicibacterium aichiense]SUA13932.1 putative dinucleotide-binding enzyme [Mycolicibacterium aichiense]